MTDKIIRQNNDGTLDVPDIGFDYTDPESAVADPHNVDRLQWSPMLIRPMTCTHCLLPQRMHINGYFCPEWRLRQLDGDR